MAKAIYNTGKKNLNFLNLKKNTNNNLQKMNI